MDRGLLWRRFDEAPCPILLEEAVRQNRCDRRDDRRSGCRGLQWQLGGHDPDGQTDDAVFVVPHDHADRRQCVRFSFFMHVLQRHLGHRHVQQWEVGDRQRVLQPATSVFGLPFRHAGTG